MERMVMRIAAEAMASLSENLAVYLNAAAAVVKARSVIAQKSLLGKKALVIEFISCSLAAIT